MSADNKKPPADAIEQLALAIGERLVALHPFMRIKRVDVINDGVVLVERVGLFPYAQSSTAF